MRVTGLGKLILLILVIGAAFGGWRVWQNMSKNGGSGSGSNSGGSSLFGKNNGSNGSSTQSGNNGDANSNNGNSNAGNTNNAGSSGGIFSGGTAASGNEILLVTSNTKKGWLIDQISKFNAQNNGQYKIVTRFIETREAMHAILEGKVQPAIWSPSSTIWTSRLSQAWQQKNGNAILNLNDGDTYRVFFRSPLVFLTTKRKANALKPVLRNWSTFQKASGRKMPWGNLKWSHADPLTANSGMMTLGLMLADYTSQTGSDPALAASSAKFLTYVQGIERGLVFDLPAQGGSSALTKAWLQDTNRYDFITTYESNAIEAALNDPSLAVIYPNPTAVSENVGAVLNGDWLSDTQREGARAFLNFLGSEQSMREGLQYYFRPAQSGGSLSLSPVLNKLRAQGFQSSFNSAELPPYEALNAAAFAWRNSIAKRATQ